jgi:hypothetical protein
VHLVVDDICRMTVVRQGYADNGNGLRVKKTGKIQTDLRTLIGQMLFPISNALPR